MTLYVYILIISKSILLNSLYCQNGVRVCVCVCRTAASGSGEVKGGGVLIAGVRQVHHTMVQTKVNSSLADRIKTNCCRCYHTTTD